MADAAAAAAAAAKPVYMFYHVQGERGESAAHPNACRLALATPGRVTLADVLASFPLAGTASFHFRFQMAVDKQLVFIDLVGPEDSVPLMNGSVIAKVLRLGASATARVWRRRARARARAHAARRLARSLLRHARAPPHPSAASLAPPRARADTAKCASRLTEHLPLRLKQQSGSGTARARGPPGGEPAPAASPRSSSSSSTSGGGGGATRSREAGGVAAATPPPPAPLPDVAVVVPDEVDADLEGKSDYVKAKVMERRAELRRTQEARLAEVEARERSQASEQEERDVFKATYDAQLSAWAQEPSGAKRNIRALLSTLHSVLWEGAKWEPAPMAKLVMAAKVKFFFMRAVTLVHPDKHNTLDAGQRYMATFMFHTLETAYRIFQETELNA